MKNSTLWKSLVKAGLHHHNTAVFFVESFLLEVISRSQLPQNSKILYLCFRRKLLQNRHGSDWSITVCVILVSCYLVHELPLPYCMRRYMFETRKSYACSKSIEKTADSFPPLRYGFFLLTSNKLGSIRSLAQNICQSNILDKDLFQVGIWEIDAVFKLWQFLLLPIWISHVRNVCSKNSINIFQDFVLQNLNLCVKICSKLLTNELKTRCTTLLYIFH